MKPSLAEVNSLRPHDKSDRRIPWHREGKLTLSRRHFLHAGAAAGLLGIAGRPAITAAASFAPQLAPRLTARALRSAQRRVGQGRVRTGQFRWLTFPSK